MRQITAFFIIFKRFFFIYSGKLHVDFAFANQRNLQTIVGSPTLIKGMFCV